MPKPFVTRQDFRAVKEVSTRVSRIKHKMIFLEIPLLCACAMGAWASERVIYNFDGSGGDGPQAGLITDSAGNLYGTTVAGGSLGAGTVFELKQDSNGNWKETVLHSFSNPSGGQIKDGCFPYADVVFDNRGNLYGTTTGCGAYNGGIVYELTLRGTAWIEKILYNFRANATDGYDPSGGLVVDAAGNLFGTTELGGAYSLGGDYRGGTLFKLTRTENGEWQETILHSFCSDYGCADGSFPCGNLTLDASGNIFGTTFAGGSYSCFILGCGNVFELSRTSGGSWVETSIYSFQPDGKDGFWPLAGVMFDLKGSLLGTTSAGGANSSSCGVDFEPPWGCGTIFELVSSGSGDWQETILHSFNYNDGANPVAGITSDGAGHYYGTAHTGGGGSCLNYNNGYNGCGTAFEFSLEAGGSTLHNFQNNGIDGIYPDGVAVDSSGNVYGTTYDGGLWGLGAVFEITRQ